MVCKVGTLKFRYIAQENADTLVGGGLQSKDLLSAIDIKMLHHTYVDNSQSFVIELELFGFPGRATKCATLLQADRPTSNEFWNGRGSHLGAFVS